MKNPLVNFELNGPNIERSFCNLDTDQDSDDMDDDELNSSDDETLNEADRVSVEEIGNLSKKMSRCTAGDEAIKKSDDREGWEDTESDSELSTEDEEGEVTEEKKQTMAIILEWVLKESTLEANESNESMEVTYMDWMDREKSKGTDANSLKRNSAYCTTVFKTSWHAADMEPGATERYSQAIGMVEKQVDYDMANDLRQLLGLKVLKWLEKGPFFQGRFDHRTLKDMRRAHAAIGLFFSTGIL